MIFPKYLQKGSKIMLVAPARKITESDLAPAIKTIQDWGFDVVTGKNVYGDFNQYSGTDLERISDFQAALNDSSVEAIICIRGGFGSLRILDALNFEDFKKHPKWLVGYSDITALHSHLHTLGIASLHATMPVNFDKSAEATDSMRKVLMGESLNYSVPFHALNRMGKAEGELVGGNLSLLYALQGSKSDLDTRGKILFLEDLDEYLYHLDRMIISLKRSGKLTDLAGLIIGGMTEMKDNVIPFGMTPEQIIADAVKEYKYPVCFNFPAGHIDNNMALLLGVKMKLEVTTYQTLCSPQGSQI